MYFVTGYFSISLLHNQYESVYSFIGNMNVFIHDSTLQDQNEELSADVKKLFEEYNKMVSFIRQRSFC